MGTFIVGGIVLIIAAGAAAVIYRDKKAGKCSGGCSGCSGCGKSCTGQRDI